MQDWSDYGYAEWFEYGYEVEFGGVIFIHCYVSLYIALNFLVPVLCACKSRQAQDHDKYDEARKIHGKASQHIQVTTLLFCLMQALEDCKDHAEARRRIDVAFC